MRFQSPIQFKATFHISKNAKYMWRNITWTRSGSKMDEKLVEKAPVSGGYIAFGRKKKEIFIVKFFGLQYNFKIINK